MQLISRHKLSELLIRAFNWIGTNEYKKVVFDFHSENPMELDKWLDDFTKLNARDYVNCIPQAEYDNYKKTITCYLSVDKEMGRWIEDYDKMAIGSISSHMKGVVETNFIKQEYATVEKMMEKIDLDNYPWG